MIRKKSSADEIAAFMAESLGMVKEAGGIPTGYRPFDEAVNAAGSDCAALTQVYNYWIMSGRLTMAIGDAKAGSAMAELQNRRKKCQ